MKEENKITTEQEVEKALKEIAKIDLKISDANNNAEEIMQKAKAQAERATQNLAKKKEALIASLKDYSDENRDEVYKDGKKSHDFVNGTIGYRQNPDKIEVAKETAELLEGAGFGHCVKVTKKPILAALKGFSEEQLKKVKAERVAGEENFFVKTSEPTVKIKGAA